MAAAIWRFKLVAIATGQIADRGAARLEKAGQLGADRSGIGRDLSTNAAGQSIRQSRLASSDLETVGAAIAPPPSRPLHCLPTACLLTSSCGSTIVDADGRRMPMACLKCVRLLGAILVPVVLSFFLPLKSARASDLIAPGTDSPALIQVLQQVNDRLDENHRLLSNIRLSGRMRNAGAPQPVAPSALKPEAWRPFLYVAHNGKAYFDFVTSEYSGNSLGERAYRLDDGKSLYSLNPKILEIMNRNHLNNRWLLLANDLFDSEMVRVRDQYGSYSEAIKSLKSSVESSMKGGNDLSDRVIRCHSDDDTLRIEVMNSSNTDGSTPFRYIYEIAPKKAFNMIRFEEQRGFVDPDKWLLYRTCEVSYDDAAPGVFVEKSSTTYTRNTGAVAIKNRYAGTARHDVVVDHVDLGDFVVDESLFDPASLPIRQGTLVQDHRTQRELVFEFGREPLDEQILLHGAEAAKVTPGKIAWARIVLVGVNVLAFIVLLVLFLQKRRRVLGNG